MAKFNKYVQIENKPSMVPVGLEKAITAAAARDARIIAVLEDMGFPGMLWFKQHCPDRMIECGIAEQNAAVMAAGLAAEGFIPIINSFLFADIGRAYNQIRQSILVDRFNVKFIGREGAWGEPGISHNTVEGIGSTRVLPNLIILNPADAVEAEKAAEAMLQYVGPVLLRQESSPPPVKIFADNLPFDIGRAFSLKDGRDATIIATGYMLTEAVSALDILEKDGLDVGLLDMCTLKPLDDEVIVKVAAKTGAIVTVENGTVIGGLGDGVAAVLAENLPTPMVKIGIEDEFSQSGKMSPKDELKEHFGLRPEDIAVSVKECIAKKVKLNKKRK
ncbi:MAG: transketolase family protein [Dehalococcoidales bacterium]|nr:transketolase family protein [Dehalococcoidales bacterium]